MLHDIGDQVYHCEYSPRDPEPETDRLISCRGDQILLKDGTLPRISETADQAAGIRLQYLFRISDTAFYLPETPLPESENLHYVGIHQLRTLPELWLAFAGVTGYHLSRWYQGNRYCGACAAPMSPKEDERALVCPNCGQILYPSMSVAIIVGIIDRERDRILCTQRSPSLRRYALVSGYTEIGETLEDTVRREVMEEVGLRIRNIRYYDNQPWGFSQTLMIGFFADLDGATDVHVDHRELCNAVWLRRDEIPGTDTRISLTGKMMEAFRQGEPV